MIAVIRLVLAKERFAKLFCHKSIFADQAGVEREFDQELITGFASALVSPRKKIILKKIAMIVPKASSGIKNM